ncbi:MAG: N-acetylmuramic acid 6-phosphate etherase [Acidobacteria bacterium]|nr:N-acetylmuramic acid 6-phosphate etherase [Acidobacteriota bacterium]
MLESLLTEQRNPASERIDALPTEEILAVMNDEDRKVAHAVGQQIPDIAMAVNVTVERLERGGRLFYIGAGTSGRLGVLDASECLPTFNVPPETVQGIIAGGEKALSHSTEAMEDDPEAGRNDLMARGFTGKDVLVGIAASGRTPYVLGAVEAAHECGGVTIGISCTPESELAKAVKIPITVLTGPEVLTGSTRLKAGTATKLVLNMLSTAVMIRLGYVFGNLMVNVQPTNHKLRDRAVRIIATAAGMDYPLASELLEKAGGSVKTAIVMARRGMGREAAERRLKQVHGRVAEAIRQD